MTIGEALKRERESLGLTQEEMTKNIIQKSHYSKIERNIEGISADSLFKILFAHHIDVDEFLESIKDTYTSKEDVKAGLLEKRMMNAFNTSNTEAVKKCLAEILELDENLIFKYRALIAVATFDGNLDQLSENTRKNIVKKFNDFNNWVENIDSLRLLANCMSVFTQAQLDNNIDYLLNYYRKKDDHPEIKIERVAMICNNYLYYCYYSDVNGDNIKKCLDYLKNLPKNIHFLFYHISCNFYTNLFNGNKKEAIDIKESLCKWGYENRVKSWKV